MSKATKKTTETPVESVTTPDIQDNDPISRVKSLLAQAAKETENVKTQLARELQKAANTYKVILEIAPGTNVWKDPQFSQALDELSLCECTAFTAVKKAASVATGGTRIPRGQTEPRILEILASGPKSHSEIKAAISAKFPGATIGNQYIKLEEMIEAKKLVSAGELKDRKFSLAGKK